MKKRQIIKITRNVVTGRDAHTDIIIWKEGRSWKCETGMSRIDDVDGITFEHECNELTLRETRDMIDEKWNSRLYDTN